MRKGLLYEGGLLTGWDRQRQRRLGERGEPGLLDRLHDFFLQPRVLELVFLPERVVQEDGFMVALDLQIKIHALVEIGVGKLGELLDGVLPAQAELFRHEPLELIAKMCFYDFDMTADVPVEFLHFFRGNPVFLVLRSANRVRFESTDILILHLELGHVPGKQSVPGIPAGSDLTRVIKVQDRIKNGLLRQARREGLHTAVIDQLQFLQTDRTIQNHVVSETLHHSGASDPHHTQILPKRICHLGSRA